MLNEENPSLLRQKLWKQYFKVTNEFIKLQPEMERINEKKEYAENVKNQDKLAEVEMELNRMGHRLFMLRITYIRTFCLLLQTHKKFMCN